MVGVNNWSTFGQRPWSSECASVAPRRREKIPIKIVHFAYYRRLIHRSNGGFFMLIGSAKNRSHLLFKLEPIEPQASTEQFVGLRLRTTALLQRIDFRQNLPA